MTFSLFRGANNNQVTIVAGGVPTVVADVKKTIEDLIAGDLKINGVETTEISLLVECLGVYA